MGKPSPNSLNFVPLESTCCVPEINSGLKGGGIAVAARRIHLSGNLNKLLAKFCPPTVWKVAESLFACRVGARVAEAGLPDRP